MSERPMTWGRVSAICGAFLFIIYMGLFVEGRIFLLGSVITFIEVAIVCLGLPAALIAMFSGLVGLVRSIRSILGRELALPSFLGFCMGLFFLVLTLTILGPQASGPQHSLLEVTPHD
ncbi:MAG: hypothetical protein H0T73_22885 [Ardenticatenales bacterium]|nr:hypothetical protein [Ardenticatenales bacterium]